MGMSLRQAAPLRGGCVETQAAPATRESFDQIGFESLTLAVSEQFAGKRNYVRR
jgi:hypothetical protein